MMKFEAGSALYLARRRKWRAVWLRACALIWNLIHLSDTLQRRRVAQAQTTVTDEALAGLLTKDHPPS